MIQPQHFSFILTCITSLFFITTTLAQQTIRYGSKTFGTCETIEASLGSRGKMISVFIAEHEFRAGYGGAYEKRTQNTPKSDNLNNVPKGYTFILETNFKNGLPFPITPEDSVYINITRPELDFAEKRKFDREMAQFKKGKNRKNEEQQLKQKRQSLEAKTKEIAQKMKEGKMSPEEAMKKLDELQKDVTSMVDNASIIKEHPFTETIQPTLFSTNFIDTKNGTQSEIIHGTLHIIRFNKKEFVAEITGKHVVECLEKRTASSREAAKKCKETISQLLPENMRVLREGDISLFINVKLKKFEDFRD